MSNSAREIAEDAIRSILARYPGLAIHKVERDLELNEIDWTLPVQKGVKHEVSFALSNDDELHFGVENFYMTYFPCTEPGVVEKFLDAVFGYLDGNYQIVEHYRRTKCVQADLQAPLEDGWQDIATRYCTHWPFPRKKTYRTVKNG